MVRFIPEILRVLALIHILLIKTQACTLVIYYYRAKDLQKQRGNVILTDREKKTNASQKTTVKPNVMGIHVKPDFCEIFLFIKE